MTMGKVVDSLPERGTYVPESSKAWDEYAEKAHKVYPKSVLVIEHEDEALGKAARSRRRPPYRTDEGYVKVSILNSQIDNDGVRRGDIYFTWVPNGEAE